MKKIIIVLLAVLLNYSIVNSAELVSPNGAVKIKIRISEKISYDIIKNGNILLENCSLGMTFADQSLVGKLNGKNTKSWKIDRQLMPVIPIKYSKIQDACNVLLMHVGKGYAVEFRAYNEGFAYRIITDFPGPKNSAILVQDEDVSLAIPDDYQLHLQPAKDFTSNYETNYIHLSARAWKNSGQMVTLPALIETKKGVKILFAETDLSDYPCLFLKSKKDHRNISAFSPVALKERQEGDRFIRITESADYIAKTNVKRSYPWRYFILADDDRELLQSTLPVKLAPKSNLENTSWIKPGQVSWEWWNGASPYGPDVKFESGFNLETYQYFIDFASKNRIPYIIMDEGWAESVDDPYTPNKKVNLHELIDYGKKRKVDIILWLTWLSVERNMGLFKKFSEWGIKGVKIDFMDRNDQWMVNYYERVAKEAAKYNIMVDFHGSFTPKGLEHKYPNVISYEGVRGLEQMEGCRPENTIYLPFIRNVVGPMDFTPGAMINMQPEVYGGKRPNSASIGTRSYQLALFVLFESGLQMLCDNPTMYKKNQDCTDFITQVPVQWDETIALVAKLGEVAVVAKRSGQKWFIGGITNDQSREISLNLNFLPKNKSYKMTYFSDGINANRQAMDYVTQTIRIDSKSVMPVKLSRNGGFAAVLESL
ncbi:glycoside hydrolase family 97 protein [uncultured Pedobacter sp.]|uniref:glycoside hydrolase family 97 protein n=1 Tax=uncultured Pedobacter sp. TaxID=246139 RepID=UPI0025EC79D5|nr:glycoside hydrolase family 97 protein [uncultured Pedobacter sp.]